MQRNRAFLLLSVGNTQAFTNESPPNHGARSALAPLAELPLSQERGPGRAAGETFFFKIAAYFLRSRFGFPGADTEVSGQDGNQRCTAVSAPAAQGAGVAIIGPACFLPHDTYQVNLLLSLFVLTS